ncbi:TonB-dependent receptor domain-containing protein [Sphingobacterium haloxyli]|uniref:TonB-dependent receptor n=1 Tax=Sphingobacterium haloxyli TaxID=2100533 RepID=A0A2S9J1Q5_9SPHI|nr:TonB-dependent receptor [Sphingobacterium haloxyli]PRD46715.1 TonB-dependent receptor [Sphingobacterium haloxyli]
MQQILPLLTFLFITSVSLAQEHTFFGRVLDKHTDEFMTGATVSLRSIGEPSLEKHVAVGLDGTFRVAGLPIGRYAVTVSLMGYNTFTESVILPQDLPKLFIIERNNHAIESVSISARARGTDADARRLERLSPNVINIISAKQIELSPDITVANVVQRVSGLSIERNANGDPQYAVVRGMNKRYNNTLMNGIKIPSPDNDNRFVPLDIFPAVFLERLTVSKSLSADMEADAIGGTIDMIMKAAPSAGRIFEFDVQTGANVMNFDDEFIAYDRSDVYKRAPAERYGPNYEAVPGDFPTTQFDPAKKLVADILASASYGERFWGDKFGVLLGASYQASYRPNENYFYDPTILASEGNPLRMNQLIERRTSTEQQRMAFHANLDYVMDARNNISMYAGRYHLNEFRNREQHLQEGQFTTPTGFAVYPMTRITNTYQTISVANLNGKHQLSDAWKLDWKGVYSVAMNELPDDAIFMRTAIWDAESNSIVEERAGSSRTGAHNSRWWERNRDNDLAFYLNSAYQVDNIPFLDNIQFGGMYRSKERNNNMIYYNYTMPLNAAAIRGVDWMYFSDVQFDRDFGIANGYGDGNESNLIYDADETVIAYYTNTQWNLSRLQVQAGLRAEHTEQGYYVDNSSSLIGTPDIDDRQRYMNLFPSVSLKYALYENAWLKSTYYKGISRPGFYEIVPTNRRDGGGDSFYNERGNPDLRPTIAHNFDVRYELFPNALDQILAGVFYKRLIDPIEYGFPMVQQADERPSIGRILPQNFGTATNFGMELDYTKYFRKFGIRANYTYTNSSITTNKIIEHDLPVNTAGKYELVDEERPLQGQSAHVGNIALLYKNISRQWDAQLVLNYTGKRLAVVSPYEGTDQYMTPMAVLDFSLEKGFGKTVVFLKANNLLNTPYQLIIDKPIGFADDHYRHQDDPTRRGNIRRDLYGESFRIGVRYKL